MWGLFALTFILIIVLLYSSGTIILKSIGFTSAVSICAAPLVSISLYCIIGTILGLAGIATSGLAILLASLLISLFILLLTKRFVFPSISNFGPSFKSIVLYCFIGIVITIYFYVAPLDGTNSFVQLWDNAYHLNLIEAFSSTGRFSILQASADPTTPLAPLSDLLFYPAGWHTIAAMAHNMLGGTAALAENATNAAFLSFVYPLSFCLLFSVIFQNDKAICFVGAFIIYAFSAFPWGFLVAGPLYSNFASTCILPSFIALALRLLPFNKEKFAILISLAFGFIALAITQTNSLFTALIILFPYICIQMYRYVYQFKGKRWAIISVVSSIVLITVFWIGCSTLGFMQVVVHNPWSPYVSHISQAVIDYIDLGFRNGISQILLSVLTIIGLVAIIYKGDLAWVAIPYLFFLLAYINAAYYSADSFIGSLLSGYWYNDVDRIAANSSLLAMLFASTGFLTIIKLIEHSAVKLNPHGKASVVHIASHIIIMFILFCPTFILAGRGEIATALGSRHDRLAELATTEKSLTEEELDFLKKCKSIVGNDRVLNFPLDGSAFAYAEAGLNIQFRSFFSGGEYEPLQTGINRIGTDHNIDYYVKRSGARYIILLDKGAGETSTISPDHLDANSWRGFYRIDDTTKGLEVVLSDGDMRLYRILQS